MRVMQEIKKESGIRLQKARNDAGYSLTKMSAAMNGELAPSRISNYEQGTRMMTVPTAIAVSDLLGVSPAYLLVIDESLSPFDRLNKSQMELWQLMLKISAREENEVARISRMIKSYLDE